MRKTRGITPAALLAAALAGGIFGLPQSSFAASGSGVAAQEADQANSAAAKLNKSQFKDVKVTVDGSSIATLTGTVSLLEYKTDAGNRVRKAKGIGGVRNEIEVGGPTVSDDELKAKLLEKLTYDRVGYGNAFNAISLDVQNGVVTLGGHARTDVDKDSAMSLVSTYPGVKDAIDNIDVDPVSIMDDQARLAVARAIYGYPSLNKYAIDPAKPIRISMQNGHVELYGVVDSESDKDTAYIRANAVPGIFSVRNYLQVANQPSEKPSGQAQR
jgi:hyperosmotically inducible protein